jgi:hypothetical protein
MNARTLVGASPDHVIGHIGPVICCIWRGDASVRDLDLFEQAAAQVTKAHPRPLLLVVLGPHARPPGAAFRERSAWLMSRIDTTLGGSALVIETPGFAGAVQRSILLGIAFVARVHHPFEIFASTDEALPWLATKGEGLDVEALRMDIAALREA